MEKNGCGAKNCKYHFGERCFKTQAELKLAVKPTTDGQPYRVADGFIYELLCLALEVNPDRDFYPDDDPDYFWRQWREGFGWKPHFGWQPFWQGFDLEDDDLFSYSHVWQVDPVSTKIRTVMRREVKDQVDEVRQQFDGECDVHHETPFKELLDGFLEVEGLGLNDLVITAGHGEGSLLKNRNLADRWFIYHQHNTTLVALTKEEHYQAHRDMKSSLQ